LNEQRFWLVSLAGIVLLLGVIYWLHRPGDEAVGPAALSPEDVAALISEAVTPLQETIAEQAAVLEAMAGTQRQLASAVEQSGLREALEQEIAQNAEQTRDSLKADLVRYEARLDDLQARADDPAVANEIAATRAEIDRIEVLLDDLSTRVDCASLAARTSVRTLVMPARSSLEVPDETVVISVGRLRNDAIDAVSINARAALDEPISTRVVGEVAIGSSVEFRHESLDYVATFTHATRRFLNSALIGVELRSSPIELAECR
jgi:hypothetical protein